jgi:hypothetical protein
MKGLEVLCVSPIWPRAVHIPYRQARRKSQLISGVVDEEEQFVHNAQVVHLHSNTYSRPFTMPPAPALAPESARPVSEGASCVSSPGTTFSELASSEIGEISEVHSEELKLRDPSKLRSSQLTDATYRQYVLDYMTQETVTALTSAMRSDVSGSHAQRSYVPPVKNRQYSWNGLRQVLSLFPESFTAAGGETSKSAARNSSLLLDPFSVPDLLDTPHLSHLARLVVDHVTRQEEKRRRRRLRDGQARPADLKVEADRKLSGRDWRLTESERQSRMLRLTTWVIRNLHEDGAIVHLDSGYLPLTPELLFPVLLPIMEREEFLREGTFMRKDDPRRTNGVMVDEILARLGTWGKEGRWERVRGWVVEDAMRWAEIQGWVKKRGNGWDMVKRHD